MAFGKKVQAGGNFDQSNVSMLASAALDQRRSMLIQLGFRAVGDTPLLMNRWSQKAIMQMLGKMVGQPQPRDPKDLTSEFENSYYRNEREERRRSFLWSVPSTTTARSRSSVAFLIVDFRSRSRTTITSPGGT